MRFDMVDELVLLKLLASSLLLCSDVIVEYLFCKFKFGMADARFLTFGDRSSYGFWLVFIDNECTNPLSLTFNDLSLIEELIPELKVLLLTLLLPPSPLLLKLVLYFRLLVEFEINFNRQQSSAVNFSWIFIFFNISKRIFSFNKQWNRKMNIPCKELTMVKA